MFDTMTMTKIIGGFCGAFLIFLLGKWVAEELYHVGPSGHGGYGEVTQGYVIDTGEDETAEAAEDAPTFAELFAVADAGRGERAFNKCRACHKLDGTNGTGPYLNGVVGRTVDAIDGFNYSLALEAVADVWTPENLDGFLTNPRGYAPGTTMGFNGISNPTERANLIAYLATFE